MVVMVMLMEDSDDGDRADGFDRDNSEHED